jgi:hypothetical protein
MTAARTTPSTALTVPQPACPACRLTRTAPDEAFIMGTEVGARAARLDLCDRHQRMAREVGGRVGLHLFGLAARAQSTVEPRLTSSQISPARRKRRRAWIAAGSK